jgi:flagellar hook-associated protein 3 FlgL
MITNLDAGSEAFLAAVARMQRRLAGANQQAASGKRVTVASDAPDEVSELLQLKADQRHNTQIQANLALAKTDADAADQAIGASLKLIDRALVLGTQSGNPLVDAAGRQSLAREVQSLQEQMVAYSRTSVQGRYIFSGDQDLSPAYSLDLTTASGVVQLNSSAATVRIEDAAGGSFASSKTAQEIFDNRNPDGTIAPDNVFAALNSLRLGLVNNDSAAIDTALTSLRAASYHLNSMESFYGAVQNRIQNTVNFAATYDIALKTQLSQKEDADITAAAVEMSQANTQLQAAFQMRARLPRSSLFDYLG